MQENPDAGGAGDEAPAPRSPAYANYVLGVLFVVYVLNFIDRQAMSVFIGPIKAEFDASDTAMGLLVGFAFALLYTFAGIPIARLADRANRRNIIAVGLAVWSAMTILTGAAKNFTHLLLARLGVGIGEAAGTPPAHSLIADYFPIQRRGTALAIYSTGVFAGSPAWLCLMAGASALSIIGYGILMWGYEFFERVHHLSPVLVGQRMALIVGVCGCGGTLLGGILVDRLALRRPAQVIRLPGMLTLAGMPFGAACLLLPSSELAFLCMAPFYLLLNMYIPAMYSANQNLARLGMRATASAIVLFIINIVGAGAGPFIVGALSDAFAPWAGEDSLRYALLVTVAIGAVGCCFFLVTSRWLERDLERVRAPARQ